MARIFAKALNCVNGPTTQPCGVCDICRSIATGEDVDVLEIDGASNRTIEEIRSLRQGVNYRPSRAGHKIYIIDEVHMLTKEAFNALLKTLEEPPAHVKFIFATTEPQKVPITILSRCQRFDFAGVPMERIIERLGQIVAAEGLTVDGEALEFIARRAGGSMRDSQSLLDQLLAFGGDRLTVDDVHRVLGTAGDERIVQTADAVFARNAAECLTLVESAVAAGVQLGEFVEQLLDYFRDLLVLGVSPEASLVSMPNRMRPTMLEQSKQLSPERVLEMMDLLAACRGRMRSSTYGRTLLEMTLVRLCRLDHFLSLATAMNSEPPTAAMHTAASPSAPAPEAVPLKKNGPVDSVAATEVKPPLKPTALGSMLPTIEVTPMELSVDTHAGFWSSLLAALQSLPMLAGMLAQAERSEYRDPNILQATFPADRTYSKSYCEGPDHLAQLEDVASRMAGRRIVFRFVLSTAPAANAQANARASYNQGRELAAKLPLVRKAEEVLAAKLLDAVVIAKPVKAAPEPKSEPAEETEGEKTET
jgi:DNA polymerase-3 subunit gamma/tau